jgi:hypothetical protein
VFTTTSTTPIAIRVDPADVSLPPTRSVSLGRCRQPAVDPSDPRHRRDRGDVVHG